MSCTTHDAGAAGLWSSIEPCEIGAVPIAKAKYTQVMGTGDSTALSPAVDLSRLDAVMFCNAASLRDGLAPVYLVNKESVTWQTEVSGYRLPTKAEWEYACRAGTTGPRYGSLEQIAWTAEDEMEGLHAVTESVDAIPWAI